MNNEKDRNGFKMTEIGWLPEEWKQVPFDECILREKMRVGKVNQRDYKIHGVFPIIDQSKNYISGYWDDEKDLYHGKLPVIIFGDHTRIFKFVNFPFVCGADGTKVLVPNTDLIYPLYLFYFLLNKEIPSRGYNRHFHLLKEISVALPPLSEQKKIAAVLSAVQEAREKTEAVIAAAKELKKSLMKYLFTYGPVPVTEADQVRLKETEIGVMPEEWEVKAIKDSLKAMQYGISLRGSSSGRYPILRMNNLIDGKIDFSDLQFVNLNKNIFDKFRLNDGDILFNRTNSYDLVGKTSLFNLKAEFVFASYLIRLIANENVHAGFLNYYLNWGNSQKRLKMLATRGVSQSNISATKLKSFLVAIPRFDIQKNIAEYIFSLDQKIESEQSKKQALDQLFKSLLQNLMTGKIRVNHLEL